MASDFFQNLSFKKISFIQLNKQERKSLIWNYYFGSYKAIWSIIQDIE